MDLRVCRLSFIANECVLIARCTLAIFRHPSFLPVMADRVSGPELFAALLEIAFKQIPNSADSLVEGSCCV